MARINDNCCYKCKERHIGCHSKCSRYAAFKSQKRDKDEPYKFIASAKERRKEGSNG